MVGNKKMKMFAIGDIHGRKKALIDVLHKSKFDYDKDGLIVLGDIVDGGFNTYDVVEELLKIKNLIFIKGNHDVWWIEYTFKGKTPNEWINQGGANTLNSYGGNVLPGDYPDDYPKYVNTKNIKIPQSHIKFFSESLNYFKYNNMLFVHGGFDPKEPIENQKQDVMLWDRELIKYADNNIINGYDKVFVGHTSTQHIERKWVNYNCRNCSHEWEKKIKTKKDMMGNPVCPRCDSLNIYQSLGCTKPLKIGNLVCLDTGGGWDGKLTIMNIDTEQYWQSELQLPSIL